MYRHTTLICRHACELVDRDIKYSTYAMYGMYVYMVTGVEMGEDRHKMQRVITIVHMSGTMYMQLTVIKLCNINIYVYTCTCY